MVAWSNMASVKIAEVGEEGGKWTIKFELQQPKVSLILKCILIILCKKDLDKKI